MLINPPQKSVIAEPPEGMERYTIGDLKDEIEQEVHSNEFVEDEEGFRFIGQKLVKLNRFLDEKFAFIRMNLRVYFSTIFRPGRCKLLLFYCGLKLNLKC